MILRLALLVSISITHSELLLADSNTPDLFRAINRFSESQDAVRKFDKNITIGGQCHPFTEFQDNKGRISGYDFNCYDQKYEVRFIGSFMSLTKGDGSEGVLVDLSSNARTSLEKRLRVALGVDQIKYLFHRNESALYDNSLSIGASSLKYDGINLLSSRKNIGYVPLRETSDADKSRLKSLLVSRVGNNAASLALSAIPYLGSSFRSLLQGNDTEKQLALGRSIFLMDRLIDQNPAMEFLDPRSEKFDSSLAELYSESILREAGVARDKILSSSRRTPLITAGMPAVRFNEEKFYQKIKDKRDKTLDSLKPLKLDYEAMESDTSDWEGNIGGKNPYSSKTDLAVGFGSAVGRRVISKNFPFLSLLLDPNLFRKKGVHTGYLAEYFYQTGQEAPYNQIRKNVPEGSKIIRSFDDVSDEIAQIKSLLPGLICVSHEKSIGKIDKFKPNTMAVKHLETQKYLFFKNKGALEFYNKATEAEDEGNDEKAMKNYAKAQKELAKSAQAILTAFTKLTASGLEDSSFHYRREKERLASVIAEWAKLNGRIQDGAIRIKQKGLPFPVDFAHLENQSGAEPAAGPPNHSSEAYLRLNNWLLKNPDLTKQINDIVHNQASLPISALRPEGDEKLPVRFRHERVIKKSGKYFLVKKPVVIEQSEPSIVTNLPTKVLDSKLPTKKKWFKATSAKGRKKHTFGRKR